MFFSFFGLVYMEHGAIILEHPEYSPYSRSSPGVSEICPEGGELCMRGRNVFMGYLGEPGKTRETFDRGFWLLSGDMATIENGFVTIKGRIKDVIITSGGKNIAPYPIEDRIKNELSDFVSNCVVVGDKQKHLACLLTVKAVPDPATLEVHRTC